MSMVSHVRAERDLGDPGLFCQLPQSGLLEGLARVDCPARRNPQLRSVRRIAEPEQQHAVTVVEQQDAGPIANFVHAMMLAARPTPAAGARVRSPGEYAAGVPFVANTNSN
jgi:hypothetical protein